jgi:16S rRNA (guanine966-N2)-methyltransferase
MAKYTMRIIAGKFKNRNLIAPKGIETRPTSAKLRESLFNILQNHLEGASFLDLFAGSGAMGFEALSRGAERVVFLDKSRQALQSIAKNAADLGVSSQIDIIKGDVFLSIEKFGEEFDIIYVDPPYFTPNAEQQPMSFRILSSIDKGKLLKEYGQLFIEESKEVEFEKFNLNSLSLIKRRNFGRSSLFHFEKQFI